MDKVKNWLCGQTTKKNGLYVHYSTPKLVELGTPSQNRNWARLGAISKLERAVLAGHGRRLLQTAQSLPISSQSNLPSLVAKCDALHAAVEKGSLLELQTILDSDYNRRKHVTCLDEAGVGLLHKAIYYDFQDIAEYLVANYPQLVHQKDSAGRTPLHYTAVCRDPAVTAGLLERAGAERGARDAAGRTAAHYRGIARTRLVLPAVPDMPDPPKQPPGLVIKRHNIRIWCHDCDMTRLQRVVWEGHGSRLLTEVSNQPVVKRFLEAVPYIMNTIREIHKAVIENDLESVMKLAGDPVPPQILSSRDPSNMTVLHKAAGLGHGGIMTWLVERYPAGIHDVDSDGRTPLHYAAAVRDDEHMYNKLVELGAEEGVVDKKNHTPRYYVNRPNEIDRSIFETLPNAPRTISNAYPPSWDWSLLDANTAVELNKKPKRKNLRASHENIANKNHSQSVADNINKISDTRKEDKTEERRRMKTSSTYHGPINFINHTSNKKQNGNVEDKEMDSPQGNKSKEQTEDIESKIEDEKQEKNNINEHAEDTKVEIESQSKNLTSSDITENTEAEQIKTDTENTEDKETLDLISDANVEKPFNDDNSGKLNEVDDQKSEEQIDNIKVNHNIEQNVESTNNENTTLEKNKPEDKQDEKSPVHKGNKDTEHSEDDDDVQVSKDTQSEYSDIHQQSTAEAENPSSAKRGNENEGESMQETSIEGIVSGEAERDSQDASITQKDEIVHEDSSMLLVDSEIDPEVAELINTSNMELLAALVLNGEGSRLVGRRSRNEELQAFLNNVPIYMQKINKVHLAAREGNIKDLQMALDRRKFAIARDPISPNGATPLHVAVVFGKTNIIKYLGGRFPETLSAVDYEGRTALHYAAVLPDNGHYYNLIQQLGANAKDLDDNGKSAEEYHKNPTLLPFQQLISDFGMSEQDAQTMLTDKVPHDHVSSRRNLDSPEALDTLERCYRLLSSAKTERTPLSASSNRSTPPLVMSRFLKRPIFDAIKYRVTKLDHDLFDVIWPAVKKLPDNKNIIETVEEDFPGGITAPDYYVYEVYHEFLIPFIKDLHNFNVYADLGPHPISDFSKNEALPTTEPLIELNIDPSDEFVLSGTIECARNLDGFELPLNLKIGQLETVERMVTSILLKQDFLEFIEPSNPESDIKGGTYYTLNEVLEKPSEIRAELASMGLLIALCNKDEIDDSLRLHGKYWPYGRGVFVNEDKTLAIWINVHDHIRVIISSPVDTPGEMGLPYSKLASIMTYIHLKLKFTWDYTLGHLSSRPTFLGAGIRFSLIINFPGLFKDPDNMKHLCAMRGLQCRETLNAGIAKISNYQCLSITESNCFNDFVTANSNLLHLEKELTLNSSAHIATLLTNMFKRKRSSLIDPGSPYKS